MLDSIEDMYRALLDGVKKESTTTINPARFNRLINTSQLMWTMVNIKDVEIEQLDIDRFRNLLTNDDLLPSTNPLLFELDDTYLRMLSTSFKVRWKSGACETGDSDFMPGHYLKTNNVSVSKVNPYRKTSQYRLHYRLIDNTVDFFENPHCTPLKCRVSYIRYPIDMFYDGVGSSNNVDCELPIHVRQEIVDIGVRIHLERVVDPRYKSYLNEFIINSKIK